MGFEGGEGVSSLTEFQGPFPQVIVVRISCITTFKIGHIISFFYLIFRMFSLFLFIFLTQMSPICIFYGSSDFYFVLWGSWSFTQLVPVTYVSLVLLVNIKEYNCYLCTCGFNYCVMVNVIEFLVLYVFRFLSTNPK